MEHSDHARCPNCSSNMMYDIKAGALRCTSCDSIISISQYDDIVTQKKRNNAGSFSEGARVDSSDEFFDEENLNRSYICSSCGGQLTPGAVSATDICPICGNAIVFTDKYKSQRVPDLIVPFTKDQQDFINNYKKECNKRLFVPDDFITGAKLENVKAWYIPFWLYDLTVKGTATYQVEDIKKVGKNSYKHTIFEGVSDSEVDFTNIPQDASREVDDRISQRLEPFHIDPTIKFNFAYLSGLDAKIYNVDSDECMKRVKSRARESMDRFLSDAIHHRYYKIINRDYTIKPNKISYALMPIWNMNIIWKNQTFRFSMNGQTGVHVAKFPISWPKFSACITASFWMLGCFVAWVSTIDSIVNSKDGMKAVGTVAFIYGMLVCYVFPKYLFSRNLNSVISSFLFFLGGCYFILQTNAEKIDTHYFTINFVMCLIFVGFIIRNELYKIVKDQNKIKLRPACDINRSSTTKPNVHSFHNIKTISTGSDSSIIPRSKKLI
ncbi:hypothetical protein [uncultured Ruminobacter sp.]|uniref:hypothetical protein n=1 Tax=uncultured Ruminobacter sp. TaxID=538947 RepID=UPI0025DF706A|nr:hypothetical protein [uncultured Ruminobacter sp.]